MPNWCENNLKITGPAEELDRFVKEVQGTGPQYKPYSVEGINKEPPQKQILCFHKLYPVPAELLRRTYGASEEDEKDLPLVDGCKSGYDWEITHWGCKWGVSNQHCEMTTAPDDDSEVGYWFMSAWAPPTSFFKHISRMFPKLRFRVTYSEGGLAFKGRFIVQDGKVKLDLCEQMTEKDFAGGASP
jgi:hypothetical protein